jgi:hypothetical protein
MPQIDWTADQGEEVRQLLLNQIDFLQERKATWVSGGAIGPAASDSHLIQDLRDILSKLEAAYANH